MFWCPIPILNVAGSPCDHLAAVALAACVRFCSNNFSFAVAKLGGSFPARKKTQQLGPVVVLNRTGMLHICLEIVLTSIGIPQIYLAVVLNGTGAQSKTECLCGINKQGS